MGIDDQFKGLDIKNLIGGPLEAATEAQLHMAQATKQFIEKVGFDNQEKIKTREFKYTQRVNNGTITDEEVSLKVPLLTIVKVPKLQVDEVNVLFDMEVKESKKTASSLASMIEKNDDEKKK